jgi:hypothetical protein
MSGKEGQSEDARDLRIRQLQQALDSRVVIEQSKGILSERFGLKMEDAFDLLRHAARTNGVKVNSLATELVSDRRTPLAIAEALIRLGYGADSNFEERAAVAEQVFADMNDALADLHANTNWTTFVCECSNPLCTDEVQLTTAILERVHANRGHYLVKPGHEVVEVEETIAVLDEVLVVRKRVAA